MRKHNNLIQRLTLSALSFGLVMSIILAITYVVLVSRLPNVDVLKDVQLQVPLRIYSNDGKLISEFGEKRRVPITIDHVPPLLIHAILATEDQRFFEHPGVDIFGLMRAAVQLARTGTKSEGGSTITMQVARNFFLSRKKSYIRKVNEILLAIKIDHEISKEKILELYLNKIYLGNRAYGVAAASEVYYGKPLSQLNLAQLALIAGLPKAPSTLNPIANPVAAKERRNHVLERMLGEGYIDEAAYRQAIAEPVTAIFHGLKIAVRAPYVAEMVRQTILQQLGKDVYTKGYQVFTTIDSRLQNVANQSVHNELTAYDTRHGYRGPLKNLYHAASTDINAWLKDLKHLPTVGTLTPVVVFDLEEQSANIIFGNGNTANIPWQGLEWARAQLKNNLKGKKPTLASDVVAVGDVIYVESMPDKTWRLSQVPEAEAALISMRPYDGAIQALVGGFNFNRSKFNRVTQAQRQASSAFKPFIYSAALEKGFTLASVLNDAPIVLDDPTLEKLWRPQNHTHKFYGPTRLRTGITRSRNVLSIRLLEEIGINYALDYLSRFGFDPKAMPRSLSLALGSAIVTPLQMAKGFAVFANGGFRVEPYLITSITDSMGKTLFISKPQIACSKCFSEDPENPSVPLAQQAHRVITDQNAYLITSTLKDVIQSGTGRQAKIIGRKDLAGKTGTTNDQLDAWFSGYNSQLLTTVWMGFDQPKSLYEYAATSALPLWINYMKGALRNTPAANLPQPAGLVTVRIDPETGLLAAPGQAKSIFETFRKEYAPRQMAPSRAVTQSPNEESGNTDAEFLF